MAKFNITLETIKSANCSDLIYIATKNFIGDIRELPNFKVEVEEIVTSPWSSAIVVTASAEFINGNIKVTFDKDGHNGIRFTRDNPKFKQFSWYKNTLTPDYEMLFNWMLSNNLIIL